ncbi:MAG: chromate efflux transporter [Synechococcus sp.]|nr:chromate efflux transporter [Synechococcus sp.]
MSSSPPAPVSLSQAARFWLRLGLVSFGGPAGQIALLQEELVTRRRWLSERRFLHALNYCMLLPGPEATQLATYLGWLMHGSRGGLIAGGLFLLPSILVLLSLATVYALWASLPLLSALFAVLQPTVLAIVLQAAWRLGQRTLHTPFLLLIALLSFVGLTTRLLPYPLLIALSALAGWGATRWQPALLANRRSADASGDRSSAPGSTGAGALHDDNTPPPDHARFRRRRLARTLLLGGLALLGPLAVLTFWQGWTGLLPTVARFFTRVALVSFGGAYAVLPYVAQGAVEQFGWLSARQMVDGLALGESTPGPLIMVVAFVGFLGGWNQTGSLALALTAGLVVVWFTFLPSFLFILAGAPLVEASREDLRLDGPLRGITAAVVGTIASLAALFSRPVLWPAGLGPWPDPGALALLVLMLFLLVGRRWSVLRVIGLACLLGLLRGLAAGLLP